MFGIMAMAIVVLVVVIMFWMWCFPQGAADKGSRPCYVVEIPAGTVKERVVVELNDSVLYCGTLPADTLRMEAEGENDGNLLVVSDTEQSVSYTFVLPDSTARYVLQRTPDGLEISSR